MSIGLAKIIVKIGEDPSNKVLIKRYLLLVSELQTDREKIQHTLNLAEKLQEADPSESMKCAYMVFKFEPSSLEALDIISKCLKRLGRHGKAVVINNEIIKLKEKLRLGQQPISNPGISFPLQLSKVNIEGIDQLVIKDLIDASPTIISVPPLAPPYEPKLEKENFATKSNENSSYKLPTEDPHSSIPLSRPVTPPALQGDETSIDNKIKTNKPEKLPIKLPDVTRTKNEIPPFLQQKPITSEIASNTEPVIKKKQVQDTEKSPSLNKRETSVLSQEAVKPPLPENKDSLNSTEIEAKEQKSEYTSVGNTETNPVKPDHLLFSPANRKPNGKPKTKPKPVNVGENQQVTSAKNEGLKPFEKSLRKFDKSFFEPTVKNDVSNTNKNFDATVENEIEPTRIDIDVKLDGLELSVLEQLFDFYWRHDMLIEAEEIVSKSAPIAKDTSWWQARRYVLDQANKKLKLRENLQETNGENGSVIKSKEQTWGDELDKLIAEGRSRKAFNQIINKIRPDQKLEWALEAWQRLPIIWENLGLQGFDWNASQGVKELHKKLAKRLPTRLSDLMAKASHKKAE